MARRISLREFQQSVVERLRDLSSRKTFASKLGFLVGDERWLVNLADVSEVLPVPSFIPVPQTRDWFRGIANVRGKLYAVADFSAFQHGQPTAAGAERRVLLIQDRIIEASGLLVSRMLGLRNPDNFERISGTDEQRPWIAARYRDAAGDIWLELDVGTLGRDPGYLNVGHAAGLLIA